MARYIWEKRCGVITSIASHTDAVFSFKLSVLYYVLNYITNKHILHSSLHCFKPYEFLICYYSI